MPSSQVARLQDLDPAWAWAPYEPSAEAPWNLARAAHLYRRAGFGATWNELQQALEVGHPATLERLLAGGEGQQEFYQQAAATAQALLGTDNAENLPAWWLHVMLHTPHPLQEKLALFWHGHFATSAAKVTQTRSMLDQNRLLRQHALGSFRPLVGAMAKDPAMLLWLDSATNRKSKPNENFAREVMELFCLGLGAYTEDDIKQAARCFTGWEVRYNRFRFNRYQHDPGSKTLLGQTGNFKGEDVIRILLEQPAAGRFLAGKLFRYLVNESEPPGPALLEPLAAGYQQRDYDTAWLVRTMLGSNLFSSRHAISQRVKSPVELGVGLLRALEGNTNLYALADDLQKLGQGVFFPPNVKGWDGGTEWINSSTLLSRVNLVWAVVSGSDGRYGRKINLDTLAEKHAQRDAASAVRWLADLLLGGPLPEEVYVRLTAAAGQNGDPHVRLARVVQGIAALPEFQLV